MPEDVTIEIPGLGDLQKAIATLPEQTLGLAERAMTLSCLAVIGQMGYPPETAANQPGRMSQGGRPLPYYERNRGSWYPVKQQMGKGERSSKTRGRIRAARAQQNQGVGMYKLIPSSEQLGRKWTHKVSRLQNGVEGAIGNTASYAAAVDGPAESQSSVMANIGWPTTEMALTRATPDIQAAWGDAVKQVHL